MRHLLLAVVLCGCASYSTGNESISYDGSSGSGGTTPIPDAGADGGTDAGADAGSDAGCVPLTMSGVPVVDCCHAGNPASATGTVNTTNCTIDITVTSLSTPCTGSVFGPSNAFDGGCAGYACTSTSLPGDLVCAFPTVACRIRIGDAGATCP